MQGGCVTPSEHHRLRLRHCEAFGAIDGYNFIADLNIPALFRAASRRQAVDVQASKELDTHAELDIVYGRHKVFPSERRDRKMIKNLIIMVQARHLWNGENQNNAHFRLMSVLQTHREDGRRSLQRKMPGPGSLVLLSTGLCSSANLHRIRCRTYWGNPWPKPWPETGLCFPERPRFTHSMKLFFTCTKKNPQRMTGQTDKANSTQTVNPSSRSYS